jgi:hypothetical protein
LSHSNSHERIVADILIAALTAKFLEPSLQNDLTTNAQEIAEAFKIIHQAVNDVGQELGKAQGQSIGQEDTVAVEPTSKTGYGYHFTASADKPQLLATPLTQGERS